MPAGGSKSGFGGVDKASRANAELIQNLHEKQMLCRLRDGPQVSLKKTTKTAANDAQQCIHEQENSFA